MPNIHPLTGQTFRVTASNILDEEGDPLTTPTVVITITDPNGTVTTPTVVQNGSTYYARITSDVAGTHLIAVTATSGSTVAAKEGRVTVYAFG